MFRKKPLEKLQTPDSLDQLLVNVSPRAVLVFGTLATVLAAVLVWSCVARIPISVSGHGILLKPRSIKTIQSSGSGVVTEVAVLVGEKVSAGQVIVKIEQPELERQLQQQISEFISLQDFHKKALALAQQRRDLELSLLDQNLKDNLESTRSLKGLQEQFKAHRVSQQQQLKSVTALVEDGLISDSQRLSMAASLTDSEQRMLRLEQELASLDGQRKQFDMQRRKALQDFELDSHNRSQLMTSVAAGIRVTKERIHRQSAVRSRYEGRVLEVAASVGQVIGSAARVATLQIEPQTPFFRVELAEDATDGTFTLIYKGHETQPISANVTPSEMRDALARLKPFQGGGDSVNVERAVGKRYYDVHIDRPVERGVGGQEQRAVMHMKDTGLVDASGSPTFGAVTEMGDLVPREELKHLGFLSIGEGKQVAEGMSIRMDPSNLERQRFGSLMGRVTRISTFPVTSEGIVNMIGNKEVVDALLKQGGTMLVEASLLPATNHPTGFQWTSKGPEQPITAGTTTTCRITVEERRPITFAIPLLRKWFLGQSSQPTGARPPVGGR